MKRSPSKKGLGFLARQFDKPAKDLQSNAGTVKPSKTSRLSTGASKKKKQPQAMNATQASVSSKGDRSMLTQTTVTQKFRQIQNQTLNVQDRRKSLSPAKKTIDQDRSTSQGKHIFQGIKSSGKETMKESTEKKKSGKKKKQNLDSPFQPPEKLKPTIKKVSPTKKLMGENKRLSKVGSRDRLSSVKPQKLIQNSK